VEEQMMFSEKKVIQRLDKMLDDGINGTFEESEYDETALSKLESKWLRFLTSSKLSYQKTSDEREKLAELISDISHQTKTPIANLLLYSELLMEENLLASAKANVHWNLSNAAIFWWPTMWWKFKKVVAVFWSAPALPC
jgi:signal transduction histidine kinase